MLNTDDHAAFMQGDESGNFRPDAYIQRCEVAQMLYNLLRDKNVTAAVSFDDVDDGRLVCRCGERHGFPGHHERRRGWKVLSQPQYYPR